jgi:hypothetical protein
MRKFKVIRKWPGGPEVGTVGEMGLENVSFPIAAGYRRWHLVSELEGFVEEITEPEKFWFVELDGKVVSSEQIDDHDCVTTWLRFPTKELAQAFADGMKESFGKRLVYWENPECDGFFAKVIDAINSRRHD